MSLISNEEQLRMKRCIQELQEYTFISGKSAELRRHPQEKEMYKFLMNHLDDANYILGMSGYCLKVSPEHSLIRLAKDDDIINEPGFRSLNRMKFSTDEIKLICTLWDLYRKGSLVSADVQVTMSDIVDAMKINGIQIGHRVLELGMEKLKHYRMIYYTNPAKYTGDRENLPIWIFPAVIFGLPFEQIEKMEADLREAWELNSVKVPYSAYADDEGEEDMFEEE